VDAEIVFTGLRPGEKLHEELILEGEDVSGTIHSKVMKQIGNEKLPASWPKRLEELIACAVIGDRRAVVEKLDTLVKGYRPDYGFHGIAAPSVAAAADLANATLGDVFPESSPEMIPPPSKSVH